MINLSVIKNISRIKKCPRGALISGAGIGHIMFIVLKGEVGVYTSYRLPDSELVATLGAGDLFADPPLLTGKKAVYTTVTLSDAIVLPIDKDDALDFIRDEPALAFEIIKDLCIRLDSASATCKSLIIQHDEQQRQNARNPLDGAGPEVKEQEPETQAVTASETRETGELTRFDLFPPEHGRYELKLSDPASSYLMTKWFACPICRNNFSSVVVRPSKLVVTATDVDLRFHYKDIEPLYYEVLTCPHCLYSALQDLFDSPDKGRPDIQKELAAIKNGVDIPFGLEKTADTVFAGFYLALFCAPISFTGHDIAMGRLLYKLSRVYGDAGDEGLEKTTAKKALEYFLNAFSKTTMPQSQEQQVCITIGELYLKQTDYRNAITFFSKAKANSSSQVLKNHADSRIYDIRALASQKQS